MVEFAAAALIVSGFWMVLELVRILLKGTFGEEAAVRMAALPGRDYVERYAQAFLQLAESYQSLPGKKEQLGDEEAEHIFRQVREGWCSRCPGETSCWKDRYYECCRLLYGCLKAMEQGEENSPGVFSEFGRFCGRGEELLAGMREAFLQERMNLMWKNRLLEQRSAAGEQIQDTAHLLKQMAERIYEIRGLNQREFRKLQKELGYENIRCTNAWIFCREEDHPEFYIHMQMMNGNCIPAKDVGGILSEVLGRKLVPARDCRLTVRREGDTFHYVTDTRYQMFCGAARMTKKGELVSGDSFAFWQGDCGQVVMSLADGMGSGVEACRESEKVIELLEQFLDAGFSQDTAVRMINSSMILQDHRKIFSTIDLCMVDLYNGRCSMIKAGACATCLKRGEDLEWITLAALPAGMLQTADYETTQRQLMTGDVLIMMTDGAAEVLPREQLEELIRRVESDNAREYARRLLEQILVHRQFEVQDDMTVLVGRIWEKESENNG